MTRIILVKNMNTYLLLYKYCADIFLRFIHICNLLAKCLEILVLLQELDVLTYLDSLKM